MGHHEESALEYDIEAKDEEVQEFKRENADLRAALKGLMFAENMLPNWDSSATDQKNPFDVARYLIGCPDCAHTGIWENAEGKTIPCLTCRGRGEEWVKRNGPDVIK